MASKIEPGVGVPAGATAILPDDSSVQLIEPTGRWPRIDLHELWRYRGLFFFLVWKDIKVRYAQTVLGAGWAVLQPVLTMVVFSIVFGSFAGISSDGVPYPVFSLAGLVLWTYFSTALTGSSSSLVGNVQLVTKVYFPRLVIPLAPVLAGLVDFGIAFVILLLVMLSFGMLPAPASIFLVPLLLFAAVIVAAGVGLWLSALNIQYRDFKYVAPFLVQVWMYASPVAYPMSIVPERYHLLYALNPMVGVIESFRAILLRTQDVQWWMVGASFLSGTVVLVGGALYFRRMERVFADVA